MTRRIKADGVKFEKEFKEVMEDRYYVRRLPTIRTGYAGLSQPADFILVGNNFNYIELKETARNSFSISGLQQLNELIDFLSYRNKVEPLNKCSMNYWLIVRFINSCICIISNEDILALKENKKTLNCQTPTALKVMSLQDLKKEDLF